LFGLITIAFSFLCEYVGQTVLQLSLSIFGLLGGPLLGVISLGMFVPFTNSYVTFINWSLFSYCHLNECLSRFQGCFGRLLHKYHRKHVARYRFYKIWTQTKS